VKGRRSGSSGLIAEISTRHLREKRSWPVCKELGAVLVVADRRAGWDVILGD
jgi:hypothetical protein